MEGIFINSEASRFSSDLDGTRLTLLAKAQGLEIMLQVLVPYATVWIVPADEEDTVEVFYVLSGRLTLLLPSGPVDIKEGGCFHVEGLTEEVSIRTEVETKLLYMTNKPLFDDVYGFQGNLNELMAQVDEKDHYTYRHCRNVMEYSRQLMERVAPRRQSLEALLTAALFHDLGKCFVPDEILQKKSSLTSNEVRIMMKHPLDSARLLTPRFGTEVARIARSHHERLDGSGYPYGLQGDEIFLEGRIIAVADSFDAMTTHRPYITTPKSFADAAEELYNLPNLYDRQVTAALWDLVASGELQTRS